MSAARRVGPAGDEMSLVGLGRFTSPSSDVLLGSRQVRTGLVTEVLGDGSSYFVGLRTHDVPAR